MPMLSSLLLWQTAVALRTSCRKAVQLLATRAFEWELIGTPHGASLQWLRKGLSFMDKRVMVACVRA